MKKLLGLLGIVVSAFSPPVFAATGGVSANISILYVPNSTTSYGRVDLVNYDGLAGTCPKPPAAVQIFMLPATAQGDRMRQVLLAAQLAGKKVVIYWDDTKKDTTSGYCMAQYVGILT